MNTINLNANTRTVVGRKTKNLRAQGQLPANVYGNNQPSVSVSVSEAEFKKVFSQAGETGLVELILGTDKKHVLISNVSVDPVSGETLHVDFRQVSLTQKVEAQVPVEIVGESPAEKSGIGTVVAQISEIEVSALPLDLPENFTVDVSSLEEVDQAIYIKDLDYDKSKIEILDDQEAIVVAVAPPQKEEVIEVAPVETEIITEKPAEGEEANQEKTESTPEQEKPQE